MTEGGSAGPEDGLIEGILAAGSQSAPSGQRSELLTFLFADIRGYTKFTQQHGDEAAGKLTAKFATVVRDVVAEYDGTVFELRGDEAMCVFASPRQSLRAAVALQRRFVDETLADERLPMTVGIGVDAGEAVRSDDGYRGGALNLAARLCSKAQAGEVLATNEVTHLARRIDGITYVAQNSVELKGIADPVRPVRVMPEGEDPSQQLAALLPAPRSAEPPPWMPGPLGRLSRRAVAGVAVLVLLAIGGIVTGIAVSGGGGSTKIAENSVGIVSASSGRVIDDITVPADPTATASGFGAVWTANTGANNVSRIDVASRQVTTVGVGSSPSAVATGLGAVWVANSASGTVTRLDPAGNSPLTIEVGTRPGGVTVAAGSVWVTNTGDGTVSRIDPATNKVVQTVPVGDGPTGIAGDSRSVWVADSASNTVSQIPVSHGRAIAPSVQPISVGNDPTGVAIVGTNVWVTNNLDGTIDRIAGNSVSGVDVGGEPTQITALDGRLWVSDQAGMSVSEVDPATSRVIRRVPLGVVPGGLAAVNHRIWVSATVNPLLHRGGTLRVVGPDPFPLDPAYLAAPWTISVSAIVYDGLVGYRHAAGAAASAVVPDLATAIPQARDNGKTYVFTLRDGVRWSTGNLVTVDDIQRGLERSIAAGFTPFPGEIVGAGSCTAKHCSISGITVQRAARTITIRLIRPNHAFLSQLASYAAAAPAGTPLGPVKRPIPGTGPYQFGPVKPGKQVTLIRNRFFHQWSAAAQPAGLPDQISYQVSGAAPGGAPGRRNVAAVGQGRYDITDARGTQPYPSLQAAFGDRVYLTPTLTTHGLALNTRVAPFSSSLARQAVAFAINRSVLASKWFTDATVTCQVLPPDFPAHRPYCPFTTAPNPNGAWDGSDVAKAQGLVDRSGTKGAHVVIYTPPNQAVALRQVVTAMRQIGYHPRLKVINSPNYFGYIDDSRHRVQAAFFGWVADDFSAADFFVGLFDCKSFHPADPNNNNPAEFCDPSIDRLINRAVRLQSTSLAKADVVWAKVDRRVTHAAPFVPLVTPSWVDVVSRRVHNYQRSPVFGVLYDQMWVR